MDVSRLIISGIEHEPLNAQIVHSLGGPSRFWVETQPQSSPPPRLSTIELRYNNDSIKFRDCALMDPYFTVPPTGAGTVGLTYLDRRWRWIVGGGTVSGRFNVRDAKGKLDKKYEKAPIDILKLIFRELREFNVSMTGVDNRARPTLEWDCVPSYQALVETLQQLGCRDALTYDNRIKICKLGVGKSLPTSDVMGGADSVSDVIAPESIEIIGGPVLIECDLRLDPVGVEIGTGEIKDRYKHPDFLSYARERTEGPSNGKKGWWNPQQPSACLEPLVHIEPGQFIPGGMFGKAALDKMKKQHALADQYIYRAWRIGAFGDGTWKVPGDKKGRTIKPEQVVPLGYLNTRETDDIGQFAEAYIRGEHFYALDGGYTWPLETRVRTGFSLDAENLIVFTSEPVYMYSENGIEVTWPNIYLRTCIYLLDENWGTERYRYSKPTGARNKSGAKPVEHPEIIRRITVFNKPSGEKVERNMAAPEVGPRQLPPPIIASTGSKWTVDKVNDNEDEVDKQADFYWKYEKLKVFPDDTAVRSYNCLKVIEPDGLVQQVAFTFSNGAVTTEASENSEFVAVIPRYEDRSEQDIKKASKGLKPKQSKLGGDAVQNNIKII